MTEASISDSLLGQPIRRHWIALVWRAWIPGVLTVLAWLGAILAFSISLLGLLGLPPDLSLTAGLVLLVASVVPALWAGLIYYDWSNDYLTITRDQITYYEQNYIFSHRTQTVPVRQVQNVGIHVPNVIFSWLDVGHVFIDTAGQEGAIRYDLVRDPHEIQGAIFELMGRPVPTEIGPTPANRLEQFLPIYPVRTRNGLMWHRHWIVLLRRTFVPALLSLGLVVLFALWLIEGAEVSYAILPEAGVGVAVLLVLAWLAVAPVTWYIYEDWKNDFWIVTDTHIIDIVAKPFPISTEDRRQARLEDIVDVRTDVPSLFDRFINKGNVFAETAGKAQNFELTEVMDPNSIQKEIFQRRAAARARAQQDAEKAKLVEQAEFERRVVEMVMVRMGQSPPPEPPPGSK